MRNKTVLEDLDAKISLILERYNYLKGENIRLKEENEKVSIELLSAQESLVSKNEEIQRLKYDDELKELELEDITMKINKSMGLCQLESTIALA